MAWNVEQNCLNMVKFFDSEGAMYPAVVVYNAGWDFLNIAVNRISKVLLSSEHGREEDEDDD